METKEERKKQRHIVSYESFVEHNAYLKDYKAKQKQENRDKLIEEILK